MVYGNGFIDKLSGRFASCRMHMLTSIIHVLLASSPAHA